MGVASFYYVVDFSVINTLENQFYMKWQIEVYK